MLLHVVIVSSFLWLYDVSIFFLRWSKELGIKKKGGDGYDRDLKYYKPYTKYKFIHVS